MAPKARPLNKTYLYTLHPKLSTEKFAHLEKKVYLCGQNYKLHRKSCQKNLLNSTSSISIESIYAAIRDNGFSELTIQLIDNFTNDILNGKTNLTQFNQAEHAGLCCAGEMLIGAYIVSCYARTSLEASANASASQVSPGN